MKKHRGKRLDVSAAELHEILERARSALPPEDYEKLHAAVDTLAFLTRELQAKGTSLERLRRLFFGPSTEKTRRVLGEANGRPQAEDAGRSRPPGEVGSRPAKKRPGHGRNGAEAYRSAEKIEVSHGILEHGHRCPSCERGKVYVQNEPAVLVRVLGMAPIQASVYRLKRLRCGLCGEVFTAEPPPGVGHQKYDESAAAMMAVLKYGTGLPFYRLERLQDSLGIPMPAATQWDVVRRAAGSLRELYAELVRQAAQGKILHNDDTTMKVLGLEKPDPDDPADGADPKNTKERTGVFTSGIVSIADVHKAALFFTGRKHAGENLADLLAQRERDLSPPIQMCDALSRNSPKEFETILGNCLAHARRGFVDVASSFPEECRYVLESLREVYHHDALAREQGMTPAERLAFHQDKSGPIMQELKGWMREQFEEKKVEPNSGLGEAISYMQKHWEKLTLFLRKAGAPLDNTICERALKRAILHRKNALFYKTETGAQVGDLYMSLIHTAELNEADPFDYLLTLLRRAAEVARSPGDWMPWNYRQTLERAGTATSPGG